MDNKQLIKPCPCGKIPTSFYMSTPGEKYSNLQPDCCGEWEFEMRIGYAKNYTDEVHTWAIEAWNRLPRGEQWWSALDKDTAAIEEYCDGG